MGDRGTSGSFFRSAERRPGASRPGQEGQSGIGWASNHVTIQGCPGRIYRERDFVRAIKIGESDAVNPIDEDDPSRRWPPWARAVASAALIFQITAVVSGAMA